MNPGKVTRPVLCLAPVHAEVGGYPELLHGHGVHGREVGLHQLHAALVVVADAEVLQVVIMLTHAGHHVACTYSLQRTLANKLIIYGNHIALMIFALVSQFYVYLPCLNPFSIVS